MVDDIVIIIDENGDGDDDDEDDDSEDDYDDDIEDYYDDSDGDDDGVDDDNVDQPPLSDAAVVNIKRGIKLFSSLLYFLWTQIPGTRWYHCLSKRCHWIHAPYGDPLLLLILAG